MKVSFGKEVCNSMVSWCLDIFICINAYEDSFVLTSPFLDQSDYIFYELGARVWVLLTLIVQEVILLVECALFDPGSTVWFSHMQ